MTEKTHSAQAVSEARSTLTGASADKPTLAAASAIGSIARIIGKLSEADQKRVIAALAELK